MNDITGLENTLATNDKIFRAILFWQILILAVLLTAGGAFLHRYLANRDLAVISRIFSASEGPLTSEVYIIEAGMGTYDDTPTLTKMRAAVESSGIKAEFSLVQCREVNTASGQVFQLKIGQRTLDHCLQARDLNTHGWFILFSVIALLIASVILLVGFWLVSRKGLVQKLFLPLLAEIENRKVESAVGALARQVAHDIRSPLSALYAVSRERIELPDDERKLLNNAIARISGIADNLLAIRAGNIPRHTPVSPKHNLTTQLLTHVIERIISETQLRFDNGGVSVRFDYQSGEYGFFSDIDTVEFERVLSNLINNAVEAIDGAGAVVVTICRTAAENCISITDNGRGIEPSLLREVTRKGVSTKGHGTGLGLYHAKTTIEDWGGRLEIESELSKGTTVKLFLKKSVEPKWFLSSINLGAQTQVVIVDDDPTIHHIWDNRFKKIGLHQVAHCYSPAALRNLLTSPGSADCFFLVDYELRGYDETGLHLIRELGISSRSVLVTGRSREQEIIKSCLDLNVSILPKEFVHIIPLKPTA